LVDAKSRDEFTHLIDGSWWRLAPSLTLCFLKIAEYTFEDWVRFVIEAIAGTSNDGF